MVTPGVYLFALLLGIGFGTYSSIFVASALSYDLLKKGDDKKLAKAGSHAV